jgi:hypothetical protein
VVGTRGFGGGAGKGLEPVTMKIFLWLGAQLLFIGFQDKNHFFSDSSLFFQFLVLWFCLRLDNQRASQMTFVFLENIMCKLDIKVVLGSPFCMIF